MVRLIQLRAASAVDVAGRHCDGGNGVDGGGGVSSALRDVSVKSRRRASSRSVVVWMGNQKDTDRDTGDMTDGVIGLYFRASQALGASYPLLYIFQLSSWELRYGSSHVSSSAGRRRRRR